MTSYVPRSDVVSWGRVLRGAHRVSSPAFQDQLEAAVNEGAQSNNGVLAIGLRRSYGDSGLNQDGSLVDLSGLDRLISFDQETGVLHAEAGLSIAGLLAFSVPRGFFIPVTPGTKFVTLGGAVANDVHGKNHTRNGTIGRWVRSIGLMRSDGTRTTLTPQDNTGLFSATVGGLGLTGIITDVALQLQPIRSSQMDVETIAFGHVSEFFRLTEESLDSHEHTVAWIDCLATGASLGRGIFTRANHSSSGQLTVQSKKGPALPVDLPGFALNKLSVSAFNTLYYAVHRMSAGRAETGYNKLFFPLDAIGNWNRMYGRRGMYQYQSVVPPGAAQAATEEMLMQIASAGEGSFLVVLKTFGPLRSPGLMSFPMEGTTLALDFPNRGEKTLRLLDRLDAVVKQARGRLYPAKDGRISAAMFRDGFTELSGFAEFVDPAFSSSFWRKVTSKNG